MSSSIIRYLLIFIFIQNHCIFCYIEKNPNIQEWRKKRYEFEEKYKNEATYFDDMKKPKNTIAFQRKIKDSYQNNPMKIYSKEETRKFNEKEKEKLIEKGKAYNNVFGSDNCKRTLGGINRKSNINKEKFNSDKIAFRKIKYGGNINQSLNVLFKDQ